MAKYSYPDATPNQQIALKLLSIAAPLDKHPSYTLAIIAVKRTLDEMGVESEGYHRSIKHRGGMIGSGALRVDGQEFDGEGFVGWKVIGKQSMLRHGYTHRWSFVSENYSPMPTDRSTVYMDDNAEKIEAIFERLSSVRTQESLDRQTPAAQPAARKGPRL